MREGELQGVSTEILHNLVADKIQQKRMTNQEQQRNTNIQKAPSLKRDTE